MSIEYKYPMWFMDRYEQYVVKFESLNSGKVVKSGNFIHPKKDLFSHKWISHTDTHIWEDVSNLYNPLKFGSVPFSISERPKVSHYQSGGIEPIDYINSHNMNFNCGCVVKYITRNGKKEGERPIKDLKKAIDYINFEIERLENVQK